MGRVLLQFKRGARAVRFGIGSTSKTPVQVQGFNDSGTQVCVGATPQFGAASAVWAEFSPSAPYENHLITKVIIEWRRGAYIDNFTLS